MGCIALGSALMEAEEQRFSRVILTLNQRAKAAIEAVEYALVFGVNSRWFRFATDH